MRDHVFPFETSDKNNGHYLLIGDIKTVCMTDLPLPNSLELEISLMNKEEED